MSEENIRQIAQEVVEKQIQDHIRISDELLEGKLTNILNTLEKIEKTQEKQELRDEAKEKRLDEWKERWGKRLQSTQYMVRRLKEWKDESEKKPEKRLDNFSKIVGIIATLTGLISSTALVAVFRALSRLGHP